MCKTRLAVIGAGPHACAQHYPALKFIDGIELCAACDLSLEKLKHVQAKFDIPAVYTDYREMIRRERPDGTVLVLKPMELTEIALNCLEQGQNLLIEKPPGCSLEEARRILDLSRRKNKKVMVSMNRRFIPLVNRIRDLARGEIVSCSSTYNKAGFFKDGWAWPSELVFADSIHLIDLMTYICGGAKEVYALSAKRGADFLNSSSAVVLFDNGSFGTFNSHHCVGARVQRFEAHFLNMSAYLDISGTPEHEIWLDKKPVEPDLPPENLPAGLNADNYHETLHFMKWLRGEEEPRSCLSSVIKSAVLAQAIARGHKGGLRDFG